MAEEELKDEQTTSSPDPDPAIESQVEQPTGKAARPPDGPAEGPVPGEPEAGADHPIDLPDFAERVLDAQGQPIDLLGDVELNVKVELGRCRMAVEEVLRLTEGAVVELDKLAGDPVDVLVNDRLVARGEVLVLNDTFCVRVNEIVNSESPQ